MLLCGSLSAQLSGSYTVGEEGDYATLKAAMDDLMAQGNNGDVLFLITSDITETENVAIGFDPGEDNVITIKPAPDTTPTVTFTAEEDNEVYDGALIFGLSDINGTVSDLAFTRNFVIDGSNSDGGSSRDLTLQTSENANGGSSFRFVAATDNIEIANTNIIINQTDNPFNTIRITSRADARHGDIRIINNFIQNRAANSSRAVMTDGITTAEFGPNVHIERNEIDVNRYGVWLREVGGNTTIRENDITVTQAGDFFGYCVYVEETYSPDVNIEISENSFTGSSSSNTIVGVRASDSADYHIQGNQFVNLTSNSGITRGVWVDTGGSFNIDANLFNGFDGAGGVRMIEIANDLTEDHTVMISNNFFSGFESSNGSGERLDGIYIASPDNAEADISILHNTLVMNNLNVDGEGWNYYGISSFSSASIAITLYNNILINNDTNPNVTSYLYRQVLSAAADMDADHNVWYVAEPSEENSTFYSRHGEIETNAVTLGQHQANTGFDTNSVSLAVEFEMPDLPILAESMQSVETLLVPALAQVTTDFFGNDRDNPTFAGAHEPESTVNTEYEPQIARDVTLHQNYPNPFNPSTNIVFDLNAPLNVTLQVFTIDGRLVSTLLNNEVRGAGSHTVQFNAAALSSGMYIYRLSAGSTTVSGRMMLIK